MKKKLSLIISVIMVAVTILAGCQNNAGSNGGEGGAGSVSKDGSTGSQAAGDTVTISLLSWYSDEQLGTFIEAFETEYPNIKIDLQFVPPVQQYVDKFSVLVASGQMTDMFYTAAENKQEVFEQKLAVDISDMEVFSRIDPDTAATYGQDGAVYAYSPDAWIAGIFYNKAIFEQVGITSEPSTWDEFIACCKLLKEAGIEPYIDDSDNVHNIAQDLYQSTTISKERDADVQINESKASFVEKYTEPLSAWYNDFVASGLYSQIGLGLNADQVLDMFANGEIAMMHAGPWNVVTLNDKNPDIEYDVFGLADQEGNCVLSGAVNVGLSISTGSQYEEECRLFIEFMSRDDNIQKWQKITNNAIIVEGVDYSMDTVFEKFKEDAIRGNFYLPQIVWQNSAGIYKEFLTGIQDTLTGADTIENIPVRLDKKQAELSK